MFCQHVTTDAISLLGELQIICGWTDANLQIQFNQKSGKLTAPSIVALIGGKCCLIKIKALKQVTAV